MAQSHSLRVIPGVVTGAIHWKRHSIYFAALFLLNLVTLLQAHRLREAHE